MVEIFKTNINSKKLADKVLKTLNTSLPAYRFNFDLEDCDRILRAQSGGSPIETMRIIQIVKDFCTEVSLFDD
jgi:hypothetical protein